MEKGEDDTVKHFLKRKLLTLQVYEFDSFEDNDCQHKLAVKLQDINFPFSLCS